MDRLGREAQKLGLRLGQRRPQGKETWLSLGLTALAGIALGTGRPSMWVSDAPDGAQVGATLAKGDASHGHRTCGAVPAVVELPHGCTCHRSKMRLETRLPPRDMPML